MQPAVLARERHPPELPDGPDGVEVAEQEHLRRAAAELDQEMVAAARAGQRRDATADRRQPRRQLGAARVHRALLGRRRLEAHERLHGVEQPSVLSAAEMLEIYN